MFEFPQDEARVEVDVPADGEDGDAAMRDAQGGEIRAGKSGGLELWRGSVREGEWVYQREGL